LRLEALSLLLHRSPPPFVATGVALLMVASRLIDVALEADVAAAAAATSAAGRSTHDSYGLKLDLAVVVTVVIGVGCK